MNDAEKLIEKAARFIEQQKDMYGEFSVRLKTEPSADNSDHSEAEKVQETSEEYVAHSVKEEMVESAAVQPAEKEPELSLLEKIKACSSLDDLRSLCEMADELRTDLENTN